MIHLNSAGAALQTAEVLTAQLDHLKLEAEIGGYEAAAMAVDKRTVYEAAATLLNCEPTEIAYSDSATRAWCSFVYSLRLEPGDEIITSEMEFGSNLVSLYHVARKTGATVRILESLEDGTVDLQKVSSALSDRAKLVAITHAAAHFGGVNPVSAIGEIVADHPAIFLVDACQSVGQIPLDVQLIRCDALTITGRKWLRGPRGTGLLYVKRELSEQIDPESSDLVTGDVVFSSHGDIVGSTLRTDTRKFELWERSVASEIALGLAITTLSQLGQTQVCSRIRQLNEHLVDLLRPVRGITVLNPIGERSGVVGIIPRSLPPSELKQKLAGRGIYTSTMADYDAPLYFHRRGLISILRVSPHIYNTEAEIETFVRELRALV